jgi:hypothetical protein
VSSGFRCFLISVYTTKVDPWDVKAYEAIVYMRALLGDLPDNQKKVGCFVRLSRTHQGTGPLRPLQFNKAIVVLFDLACVSASARAKKAVFCS